MKLLPLLALLLLGTAAARAQSAGPGVQSNSSVGTTTHASSHDVTGFSARTGPGVTPEDANRAPNPHVVLKPRVGGVFADGARYGTVMISPAAPADLGIGEKYLAAPDPRYDLDHESGYAAHRDTGGIKLLSLEF